MSKRHQASRRRTYGRRQHELHERTERYVGVLGWIDEVGLPESGERWRAEPLVRAAAGGWLNLRGID
ncbi:MAG: hypothetical protein ABSB75_05085 [Candidatus Limnocylindrales bacterium]